MYSNLVRYFKTRIIVFHFDEIQYEKYVHFLHFLLDSDLTAAAIYLKTPKCGSLHLTLSYLMAAIAIY